MIISILVFLLINSVYSNVGLFYHNSSLKAGFVVNEESQKEQFNSNQIQNTQEEKEENTKELDWYLEIPAIELKAEICEGTTK